MVFEGFEGIEETNYSLPLLSLFSSLSSFEEL